MKTVYNTEVIMKPKRIWKIWFSPTGGTKTIVSTIAQVVDKLYILKIYKTNLKKVVERFLLLGDFW